MRDRVVAFGMLALAVATLASLVTVTAIASTNEIGQIKVVKGSVHIQRARRNLPATVGTGLQEGDVVVTGRDGSVGMTFNDDSLLSAGPNSVLAIDKFAFDSTTHAGTFQSSLQQGTLAAVSGKIAHQAPGAMRVRTPATILGVRGTKFLVRTPTVTE